MYLQNVDNVYDMEWAKGVRYGELFHPSEVEFSKYSLNDSDPQMLFTLFSTYEKECRRLVEEKQLPLPAYDYCLKCSHAFNLLDAKRAISVTERQGYIGRVRELCKACALAWSAAEAADPTKQSRETEAELLVARRIIGGHDGALQKLPLPLR